MILYFKNLTTKKTLGLDESTVEFQQKFYTNSKQILPENLNLFYEVNIPVTFKLKKTLQEKYRYFINIDTKTLKIILNLMQQYVKERIYLDQVKHYQKMQDWFKNQLTKFTISTD